MTITAKQMLEQAGDAAIYADREGIIRLWNGAAEHLFGFTAAEAIGQSLDIIIPERLRAAHWRGFDAAIASGVTKHAGTPTLTKALTKAGDTIYAEMSFAVVKDEASGEIGSIAIARLCPPKNT